ncbi:putative BCP1 family protein [Rosa chinensis]|uniref:Protein BCCIP homolog n=1 Tax=Rosa chinensis TaxID=74649 RepID=A0A2P6R581_ROSCH|nr:protein BCCIP homolog [Rosa chinensis]XP_024191088.1 protein BCCIP homolog [Rosa chinensis]XP_024191093.1 protein BCCIP homolog [Rosa chinensis]XP_024191097.1 protein BCCIP homolog [Rosa chinensis]XP_040372410.1 protein BCCIP homolog [Rosa chinensis]XP_040372411.1 protein BCCIP homolog [Rosa chinensis]PRQ41581.1 putative BCP1 family protein [Rosa chinensis]
MPRRPMRHRGLVISRPLTFSQFARQSAARVASVYTAKRQMHIAEVLQKSPPNSAGNKTVKNKLKAKNEQLESSEEEEFDGNVQVDFAFFDPKADDFHGVKTLLQTYLDDKEWDLSGFVGLILEQTTVGSVVKIEDDEDNGIFSLVTTLNLGRYKDQKCMTEINEFLLKVSQKDVIDDLRSLLGKEAHSVGLLVSQRVTNLPPQLLPPLYDGLFNEVSWATEDEPTEELKNSFRFKFYIIITKFYRHKTADQKRKQNVNEEAIIYVKPEDEIFHKLSSWSFEFSLNSPQIAPHELRNYQQTGLVMAVKADKVSTFQQQLQSLIEEP